MKLLVKEKKDERCEMENGNIAFDSYLCVEFVVDKPFALLVVVILGFVIYNIIH